MRKLVLLRHGEATWNRENRFTGWTHVDLSPAGIEQARARGGEGAGSEGRKERVGRVIPYWNSTIAPAVRAGRRVLVAAHGNSLRALVKHLDGIGDAEIVGLNIPTGIPLVYELDEALRPQRHYYLGDPEAAPESAAAVANQAQRRA